MREFEDPFDVYVQSQPTGQCTEEGEEIRLIGRRPWTDAATTDVTAPIEFREHELIADKYFYTLPPVVLNALITKLGEDAFDPGLLSLERALSDICSDHASVVGFWHNFVIRYRELRPTPIPPCNDELIRAKGVDPAPFEHGLRIFRERDIKPLERYRKGYAGWLTTNQQFLDEHDTLLSDYADTVRDKGTSNAGSFNSPARPPETETSDDQRWTEFNAACDKFFVRWRLKGLAGPYLPIPLEALTAGTYRLCVVDQLMQTGGVFYLPDTMPIPSRNELRGRLDDALHGGDQPKHLADWLHIVRAGNPARTQLDRFARWFELQHYWRILHERHSSALEGNIGHAETALSRVFDRSVQSIHVDLIDIRKELGPDWANRPWPI